MGLTKEPMQSVNQIREEHPNKLTKHDRRATEELEPRKPLRADVVRKHFDHVDVCQGVVADAVSLVGQPCSHSTQ